MEKVADRWAAEHVVYHLGWKYALDLVLADEGFHSTVLVYFRDRLEENKVERMIFDGIVKLLVDLGLVKRAGKQRLDSTHILGYVKAMSRLECATETLRLGLEDLEQEVVAVRGRNFGKVVGILCTEQAGLAVKQSRARTVATANVVKT